VAERDAMLREFVETVDYIDPETGKPYKGQEESVSVLLDRRTAARRRHASETARLGSPPNRPEILRCS
jgi:hypothetical protein